ncbi:uncharacterized protein LOC130974947 [Arachis stenosperma]|uniref:uncharacterized protein LOC130974947 n=1 Tax=Arachis stenosperma TaxID=217475 RepID=UPI0025AB87CD|nr:uncharacterized protein LOC130974947 [Arachis stenosperma]
MENTLNYTNSTLNGLTSTLQALISCLDQVPILSNQPSSSNTLPSQLLPNPKGGINAITLRSGTTLPERSLEEPTKKENIPAEDTVEVENAAEEDTQDIVEEKVAQPKNRVPKEGEATEDAIPIPFSHLARKSRKQMELDLKMVEIFKKVEVTIPLFYAIQQVPKYAKFLKDLCMHKDKINDLETIPLGSSISALMGDIPEKCGDLGPCMVTCAIEGVQFFDCMCDLGIAEDVLVSIRGLTFPIDFYILEMPPNDSGRPSSILLARPFLKTSKFKLNAFSGAYSFEIDGRTVCFNLDKAMRYPQEDHSIIQCDVIEEVVAEVHQEDMDDKTIEADVSVGMPSKFTEDTPLPSMTLDDQEPSHEQETELKPLPSHLKYAYLEDN